MRAAALPKARTGIPGLDQVTLGGLPQGRTTLVCGKAGCGKTLLAMEFLVRGATQFDEAGVFMAFEETADELTTNVRSLGFDLDALVEQQRLALDSVQIDRSEIEETGEYDLEGLFVRLGYAIDSVGAKRVVLDTLETLFGGLSNMTVLRSELRRLFRFLKTKGVTAVITAEQGDGGLTRHGLEEYVSDCVILLDHRVTEQLSTRRLRVVKYRGTTHGTNEYPFLIDETGLRVLPITSLALEHDATNERISTGVARLDAMLGGGLYRGSSVLVSGTAGTGKTSLMSHLAEAACGRGERCLYFAFEESRGQIARNMRSIGLDLDKWIERGLLTIHAARPTVHGLEMHLATMHKRVEDVDPHLVILDPISNLIAVGTTSETNAMLVRLVDFLKSRSTTACLTNLTSDVSRPEGTDSGISSLIDTWILLRDIELNGERNRGLYVLKSRGTAHSNQIREFKLTSRGIDLADVYAGSTGVLTGSSRLAQESRERAEEAARRGEIERKRRDLERKGEALAAQIRVLQAQYEAEQEELQHMLAQDQARKDLLGADREAIARSRRADEPSLE